MPIRFDQHSSVATRALQIYLILIGCAVSERVITLARLANLMGYPGPDGVFTPLEHLAGWCRREGLPSITSLVVRDESGVPGLELTIPPEEVLSRQHRARRFDWYAIMPPSVAELERTSLSTAA
jgi:hypothetical protein